MGRKHLLKPRLAATALIAGLLAACNPANPPLAASKIPFLDELATSSTYFQQVTREELLGSLSHGDLISMGETHSGGLERTYLAGLYADLAPLLKPEPVECLVENYQVLLSTSDPVRAQFNQICPDSRVTNHVTSDDYTADLAHYLAHGRVLTHTGMRHTLPFGLLYSQDFDEPQWVDIPPHGTITKQLPAFFFKRQEKMRTHVMLALEDLLFGELTRNIKSALKSGATPQAVAQEQQTELQKLMSSPALQYQSGEYVKIFEILRVNMSFPYEKAYVSLLRHPEFDPTLLNTLLQSHEFTKLLEKVNSPDLQAGIWIPTSPNDQFDIGASVRITEPGTIYFYGPSRDSSGNIVLVTISPTQGPKFQQLATAGYSAPANSVSAGR